MTLFDLYPGSIVTIDGEQLEVMFFKTDKVWMKASDGRVIPLRGYMEIQDKQRGYIVSERKAPFHSWFSGARRFAP